MNDRPETCSFNDSIVMPHFELPTREEIFAAYAEDPEAVVMLFEQPIGQLAAHLRALEDSRANNSRNSSQPPSGDDLHKPTPKSLRQSSGKPSDGRPRKTLLVVAALDHHVL